MSDEDLPNPMEPGTSVHRPPSSASPQLPKGDVRAVSWVALVSGVLVVLWYLSILIAGGAYLAELSSPLQIVVWGLALASFICGAISLNARRDRELAAAGFIAGVVSLLVSLTIGLPTAFQIVF